MKMSKLTKIVIISAAALVLILAGAFTALSIASYKPSVAFYNVPDNVRTVLFDELNSLPAGKKGKPVKYEAIILDSSIPLSAQKQVKKAKILFAAMDFDVKEFALNNKKVCPSDAEILDGMPSTTRITGLVKNEKLYAVPLLYDFYMFDISRSVLNEKGASNPKLWEDMTAFWNLTLDPEKAPFVVAGGDDEELLNFAGSMCEVLSGSKNLKSAEEKLYQAFKTGDSSKVSECMRLLCEENGELKETAETIADLYKEKLLTQSLFSFSKKDTNFFIENKLCNTAYLKLSQHRTINNTAANGLISTYLPAKVAGDRTFEAPLYAAIPLSKNASVKTAMNLLSSTHQATISYKTGLAPSNANCATPDIQADDVRFWIAASAGPEYPLASSLPSDEMKKVAAETLRTVIRLK